MQISDIQSETKLAWCSWKRRTGPGRERPTGPGRERPTGPGPSTHILDPSRPTCQVFLQQVLQSKKDNFIELGLTASAALEVWVDLADIRRILLVVCYLKQREGWVCDERERCNISLMTLPRASLSESMSKPAFSLQAFIIKSILNSQQTQSKGKFTADVKVIWAGKTMTWWYSHTPVMMGSSCHQPRTKHEVLKSAVSWGSSLCRNQKIWPDRFRSRMARETTKDRVWVSAICATHDKLILLWTTREVQ